MKRYIHIFFTERNILSYLHLFLRSFLLSLIMVWGLFLNSCEDFVEVELPTSQLNADDVFDNSESAKAALNAIYAEMRDSGILGYLGSRMGNYSDELDHYGTASSEPEFFHKNSLTSSNLAVNRWWNDAYYQIYCANDIIERVDKSVHLSGENINQIKGEALFVRGLIHFYLSQLYGDIPYVTTTDYEVNTVISKTSQSEIFNKIIDDLRKASDLLKDSYTTNNRTHPNKSTVMALLARVYLYNSKWQQAEEASTYVINKQDLYPWSDDLESVFLKESKTTIWQWSQELDGSNTIDATEYFFNSPPPGHVALTLKLVESFDADDLRLASWIRGLSDGEKMWYHAYKYKQNVTTETTKELTVVFRIAEQYLIRSEARAQLGNLGGADSDLNMVRQRAGLPLIESSNKEALLALILQERRHELFTEFGHRFFDLKRNGQLDAILNGKPGWDSTDKLLPLPEDELLVNPNLEPQNPGY
ncbi:RagB/SusD family nutrient uptake outer membrane protein [Galbibacter sp. EGI 63066]|uniref:RagB/SusD family nutrient uptake outer membrane protein n=1 Tax=Galbibacter sp. EGI 63066 TaxID=2993559 RepID=UPI002248B43C|nr:RagB/SusD family nutrient uptake outer membrane protein [Galbibacter sp. EGI 63066]MCX2680643.1 RagB/SusD family nutrient uptake outer membrane protein [Galbibacter sp. EGI 63066]